MDGVTSAKRSGIETRCVPYIEVAAARERARLRIKTRRAGGARLTPLPRRALVIALRAAGFHAIVGRLDALLFANVGAVGVARSTENVRAPHCAADRAARVDRVSSIICAAACRGRVWRRALKLAASCNWM